MANDIQDIRQRPVRFGTTGPVDREALAQERERLSILLDTELPDDPAGIADLVDRIEGAEFEIQRILGLETNAATHAAWHRHPGCRCDSQLARVVGRRRIRIVSDGCPMHRGRDVKGVGIVRSSDFVRWFRIPRKWGTNIVAELEKDALAGRLTDA